MRAPTLVCCPNPDAVAATAAALLCQHLQQHENGSAMPNDRFRLALAGGSTPRRLYQRLAQPAYRERVDWQRLEIFFGDERLVAAEDDSSNYRMAATAWLNQVPIPTDRIHRIETERGATEAAAAYAATLGEEPLDCAWLGMGSDGHTASLFPDSPTGTTSDSAASVVVTRSPVPPTTRISMSEATLGRSAHSVLLVTGPAKADMLAKVHAQLRLSQPERSLPAARVNARVSLHWLLDEEACADLPPEISAQARDHYRLHFSNVDEEPR